MNADGTILLTGDPDNGWSPGGYCTLTAMDATMYGNEYEFSAYVHFSNNIDIRQAGLIFNVQGDSAFDVFYLR